MILNPAARKVGYFFLFLLLASCVQESSASLGDHLPDFKSCVKVQLLTSYACIRTKLIGSRFARLKTVRMGTRPYVCFLFHDSNHQFVYFLANYERY
jgi:hypothetical protein